MTFSQQQQQQQQQQLDAFMVVNFPSPRAMMMMMI